MGGFGSGRRSNRPITDDCLRINLSNLKQLGMLQRHCMTRREQVWSQYGQTIAELTLVTDVHCLEPSPCLRITGHAFGKVINGVVWLEEQLLPYGEALVRIVPTYRPQVRRACSTAGSDTLRFCEGLERGLWLAARVPNTQRPPRNRQGPEPAQRAVQVHPYADAGTVIG